MVRARAGRRDEYRPIESALCASSRPEAVVDGLLALYPFRQIYIADLDAILGRGDHEAVLTTLRRAHPDLEFWVDGGFADVNRAKAWQARGMGRPVLATESLEVAPQPGEWPDDGVLSLDFRGDDFVGPTAMLREAWRWPAAVIVMTLARVGVGCGPDLACLAQLRELNPACRLYAAGGVRHAADLSALAAAGAAGVLLASALHDGSLSRTELGVFHADHPTSAARSARTTGPAPSR